MAPDSEPALSTQTAGEASLTEWVSIYLKGIAMGAADAVPGISGGTIALITGIYERLIRAITALDPTVVHHLPTLYRGESRQRLWQDLFEMDVPFLLSLGLGVVTALVALARVMEEALHVIPALTFAFFLGLIAASAVVLFEPRWVTTPARIGPAIVGFVLAFLVAGVSASGTLPHSLPVIFIAGTLAISGMVLPGISGAFILLLLGQYRYMTETLNRFIDSTIGLVTDGSVSAFVDAATIVVTFIGGALVGLFTVAYAVRRALDSYRGATLSFLVSLMVGALRYPLAQVAAETETLSPAIVLSLAVAIGVGAGLVFVLDWYTEDLAYTEA